jgi:aspartate racemase
MGNAANERKFLFFRTLSTVRVPQPIPLILIHYLETTRKQPYNQRMRELNALDAPNRMIGILGGMGPEATLDLYRHIIELTPAKKDQDHIQVLIYSNPKIPDRTQAIAGSGESPLPYLIESARLLEGSGAGIIAMPCNAAHHFLPEIRREIGIPFLDMIEETCRKFQAQLPGAKAVGLIASIGTVCSRVYTRTLSMAGVDVLLPDDEDQQKIQAAIDQVKTRTHDRSTQETFQLMGTRLMNAGAAAIILGCTEVPLAFDPGEVDYPSLNSTRILAEVAVDWALRNGE